MGEQLETITITNLSEEELTLLGLWNKKLGVTMNSENKNEVFRY